MAMTTEQLKTLMAGNRGGQSPHPPLNRVSAFPRARTRAPIPQPRPSRG